MNSLVHNYYYEGKVYPLTLMWDRFKYDDLVLNIDQVRQWCKEGCSNYNTNGGCPPYSPTAKEVLYGKEFILLACKVDLPFTEIDDKEKKAELINNMMCSFMDNLGYELKDKYGATFFTPGHCEACKECTIQTGCKNPNRRVYSITGLGIMLADTIEKLFGYKLQWFTKNSDPEYMLKIMAFIEYGENKINLNIIKKAIRNSGP
jgi:predicted metal-binding protein